MPFLPLFHIATNTPIFCKLNGNAPLFIKIISRDGYTMGTEEGRGRQRKKMWSGILTEETGETLTGLT